MLSDEQLGGTPSVILKTEAEFKLLTTRQFVKLKSLHSVKSLHLFFQPERTLLPVVFKDQLKSKDIESEFLSPAELSSEVKLGCLQIIERHRDEI